ncbi:MAG: NfeD family protein [Prolixibacteraceae bacterium]|jgi:membrane protein implicated in regulation of membrane protease activity|nr:NfeD family protein [Prolixibacteraceae bacterium]MBT6004361.1 NfeD family protein [Prolixibacteraceae bacterium]MBT6764074.1 NfeD family protein [Prolixibacteraceae bacterium]MBT6999328.1 NfeD family protein [Prolixibacteraceae bacterium]MBT7396211.1 NfeD family protein [Prolixibacteraceae bacterium]
MEFELWHIWLLIALISFIMEIFIPSFVLFNFGVGALFGSLAAGLNLSLEWQIVLFSSATLMSFFLVRPIMKKYAYKRSDGFKTNIDAMVGRHAQVTEEINNENNRGLVSLDGDIWQARSQNNEVIPKGTLVEIIQINSIVLIVNKSS